MNLSILAVDDEPDMLRLLQRILQSQTPYQLETTSSALEVPEILSKRSFDVVITDLRMPGMTGMDILQWIEERGRKEKVIIITAFGTLESSVEAKSCGAFDYIPKPFKREQLLSSVRLAMEWRMLERDALQCSGMFEVEPFEKAVELFKMEYDRRKADFSQGTQSDSDDQSSTDRDSIQEHIRSSRK